MAKKKPAPPMGVTTPANGWAVDNLYSDVKVGERLADTAATLGKPKAPTLGEQVQAAWMSETSVGALIDYIGAPDFKPDPKYNPTDAKEWGRITQGIPPEYHVHLMEATSASQAAHKRERIMEELRRQEALQGGSGMALSMGAAVLDPGAWALSAATGGAFHLTKLSRLQRFLAGGATAAGENMALEAMLANVQNTRDSSDIMYAGGLGFLLGGSISAALKPREIANLNKAVQDGVDAVDAKTLADSGAITEQQFKAIIEQPPRARVLSLDEIKARINAQADEATAEVVGEIKAKSEATMPKTDGPAVKPFKLSDVDRAKLKARVEREDAEWLKRNAEPEKPKDVVSTQSDAPLENALQAALRPVQEARAAAKAARKKTKQETSAWDQWEAEHLSVKKREEELAYAQREQQLADNPDGMPPVKQTAPQDSPQATISDEPSLTPQEAPKVEPEAPTQATEASDDILVAAGDNITVELPDGRVVGGRIKSFNEDTGMAVIDDEFSGKPVRVNLNEVGIDEVINNDETFEGFLPGSVGSAQTLPIEMATPFDMIEAEAKQATKFGIFHSENTALTHLRIPFTNFKVPIRFDYYAKFLTSENETVRRLAKVLLADPVGEIDHAGRGLNASELASKVWHTYQVKFHIAANDAYDAYAKEMKFGPVERVTKAAEFYENVTRAVRDYSTSQYTHPQVGKVVMEIQKIHNDMLALAQKYGVKGAEEILPDPFYMMRKFHHDRIAAFSQRFGEAQMIKLVKGAIKSVRPVTDEMAERIAKNYYKVVRGLPYADMNKLRLGDEGRARFRAVLRDNSMVIDDDLVDDIFDMVLAKPGKTEGDSGRLKSRTILNESFAMRMTDNEGKEVEVSMEDFFENDSRALMDIYTRQMGGHIGLAQMGIRSDADFERILDQAREEGINNFGNSADLKRTLSHMQDVYNHILGRPMSNEVYGKQERVLKAVRDFNFIRMMGQVGFAQAAEIGNTLGYAGFRAMGAHMPAMRDIIRMAKGGQMDDQLARDLINMGGLGGEMAAMHPMARSAEDAMFDVGLTKLERGLAYGRHGVAMVSGLAPITNMLRQVSARSFVQKFSDYARGLSKMGKGDIDQLAWAGITRENRSAIFSDLKKYSKVEGKTSKVESIDWEKWSAESPDTYETFSMAVYRESRRVVQENTIGETAPWMHSQIGKVLTQFRGFMLVAHAKQTLYGLHHANPKVAMAFLASTLFAGLSYTAQTSLNYAGNEEELEKRLTMQNIALSAFQRNSMSAMIPASVDTLSAFAGWEPIFKYGRSTGLASGLILGNPSVDFIFNKVGGTASNIAQMATTDDFMWTQKDVKNAVNILIPNLIGVRTFIEAATDDLPKYNTLRGYQQ